MANEINKERQLAGWIGKCYLERPITMFLVGILLVCGVAIASYFALELLTGAALLAAAAGVTAICTALATLILNAAHAAIINQAKGDEKAEKAKVKEAALKAELDEAARNEEAKSKEEKSKEEKSKEEVVDKDGTKETQESMSEPLSKQKELAPEEMHKAP
ncbi:hypothetical protein RLOatenuis_8620 [Rickettsiales bacterium]|nr:hypothetical protein RLOatenuis_8620 [Rickettsiales bacterium]